MPASCSASAMRRRASRPKFTSLACSPSRSVQSLRMTRGANDCPPRTAGSALIALPADFIVALRFFRMRHASEMPPSTAQVWPVTKAVLRDASSTTAFATSLAVATRPSGIATFLPCS